VNTLNQYRRMCLLDNYQRVAGGVRGRLYQIGGITSRIEQSQRPQIYPDERESVFVRANPWLLFYRRHRISDADFAYSRR